MIEALLMTLVSSVHYNVKSKTMTVRLPYGCCADAGGLVSLASGIDDRAKRIDVFEDGKLDTQYLKKNNRWILTYCQAGAA